MSSRRADALTRTGDILSHTQTGPRSGPSTGWLDVDGIDAESVIAPINVPDTFGHKARVGVCDLTILAGCQGQHCQQNHAAHVQWIRDVCYALNLLEDPLKGDHTDDLGNRVPQGSKKKKPATGSDHRQQLQDQESGAGTVRWIQDKWRLWRLQRWINTEAKYAGELWTRREAARETGR